MDIINVEILEDGTIKSNTDLISAPNHSSAEGFFKLLDRFCGSKGISKAKHLVSHLMHHNHVHGGH
jgi:hypothetical protein